MKKIEAPSRLGGTGLDFIRDRTSAYRNTNDHPGAYQVNARNALTPAPSSAVSSSVRKHFQRKALQRTHLHHGFEMGTQQRHIEKLHIMAGKVKASRSGKVDEGGGAGSQSAMPQIDEFAALVIAFFGMREDLFRFAIEEAQAHGAIAHDAFQVADSSAAAKAFLGIERDRDMAALPNAFDIGPAPIADAVADGPYAGQLVQLAVFGGDSRGDRVRIVGDVHRAL